MQDLARYIDHTLLKPEATVEAVNRLCREAQEFQFEAVCVQPCYVDLAAHLLRYTDVKVATVIGFPLGATLTSVKVAETREVIARKADEVDMVINLGAAKNGQWQFVEEEIAAVVEAAEGHLVKVIIETGLLTDEEKKKACEAALKAGANFVKTSTGFGPGGATVEDIRLMKSVVGDKMGIKASGGIRSYDQAVSLIEAGATRLGTSAGIALITTNLP